MNSIYIFNVGEMSMGDNGCVVKAVPPCDFQADQVNSNFNSFN